MLEDAYTRVEDARRKANVAVIEEDEQDNDSIVEGRRRDAKSRRFQ